MVIQTKAEEEGDQLQPNLKYIKMWMQFFIDYPAKQVSRDYLEEWIAYCESQDKVILGLRKQVNAYKLSEMAGDELLAWRVSEGVKAKTKELESLSSEREANAILTDEVDRLQGAYAKGAEDMRAKCVRLLEYTDLSALIAQDPQMAGFLAGMLSGYVGTMKGLEV